ncbi:MAG: glycoside hydrolase family 10 protein [Candidatus Saccharimonadaceae bacterium]
MNKIFWLVCLSLFLVLQIFANDPPATEVRAVWLTTNYGLDWPKNRTDVDIQKKELINMLDELKKYNFNTVFFQARTRGEVLYQSKIEPMSSIIAKAKFGQSKFDPLAFAIEECHKRGLSCHAWIVTYPLGGNKHVQGLGNNSVTRKKPSIAMKYKNEWFLDPGNPQTNDYLLSIVNEIVENFDIDGIQFDYIRYPDNSIKFPDKTTFTKYGKGKSLSNWRRENINSFVTRVYDSIKSVKPWVQVSSAPLGRYRPLHDKNDGWNAYETVSQDAGYWMMSGKHDALYPMMYYRNQLFYPFADDWVLNSNKRIVVPGLGPYQMLELGWPKEDIENQMVYTRDKQMGGQAYFRAENVLSNVKGILFSINDFYKYPAKLPAMTWLSDTLPDAPYDLTAEKVKGIFQLKWHNAHKERATYTIYKSDNDDFDLNKAEKIVATGIREPQFEMYVEDNDEAYYYYITTSDAFNNESVVCQPAFYYHSETIK